MSAIANTLLQCYPSCLSRTFHRLLQLPDPVGRVFVPADMSDSRGTFVAAGGGPFSGLNHNLLASLNNDLSFLLK